MLSVDVDVDIPVGVDVDPVDLVVVFVVIVVSPFVYRTPTATLPEQWLGSPAVIS